LSGSGLFLQKYLLELRKDYYIKKQGMSFFITLTFFMNDFFPLFIIFASELYDFCVWHCKFTVAIYWKSIWMGITFSRREQKL